MQLKRLHLGMLVTNCYLLLLENSALVIDPADRMDKILDAAEGKPIQTVLLTHGHLDHFFVLDELCQQAVPRIYLHHADEAYLNQQELRAPITFPQGEGKVYSVTDMLWGGETLHWTDGGETLELEVLHTPGHTPGSVCFYQKAENTLFSGDTLFRGGRGRTDFPGGNAQQMNQSLERLSRLPMETKVLPGHGFATTIGEEFGGGLQI